jgi:hypothetical protein
VHWTDAQVGCADFPDLSWIEPDVYVREQMTVVASRPRDLVFLELVVESRQDLLAEACADLADSLELLSRFIVDSEEEGAVDSSAFALSSSHYAVESANWD